MIVLIVCVILGFKNKSIDEYTKHCITTNVWMIVIDNKRK